MMGPPAGAPALDLLFNLLNVAIFAAILYGVVMHHRRRLHVRVMWGSFLADLALLAAVEISNHAVKQVIEGAADRGIPALLWVHIGFSVVMLALWVRQIQVGHRILAGRMELLPGHAKLARLFLFVRFGNLVTAFFV